MAELKTKPTDQSVEKYIDAITNEKRQNDCKTILDIMKKITKAEPIMWGDSIIGFGNYHYKYKSGREADWFLTGFSNRKQSITIYIMSGSKKHQELLEKLGKYKTSKACLYIKSLDDINIKVLKSLISESVKYLNELNKKNNN